MTKDLQINYGKADFFIINLKLYQVNIYWQKNHWNKIFNALLNDKTV